MHNEAYGEESVYTNRSLAIFHPDTPNRQFAFFCLKEFSISGRKKKSKLPFFFFKKTSTHVDYFSVNIQNTFAGRQM